MSPRVIKDIKKFDYQLKENNKRNFFAPFWETILSKLLIIVLIGTFLLIESRAAAPVNNELKVRINPHLLAQNSQEIQKLKEKLQSELDQVLREIEKYKAEIKKLSTQKRNLQQEIQYLTAQINKTELEIKAIKYEIGVLNKRINDTLKAIKATENKIENSKQNLIITTRTYYNLSRKSFFEVVLAEQNISDYFSNIVYLNKLQESINNQIDELKILIRELNYQKQKLDDALQEQENLLALTEVKKRELAELQVEKNNLLRTTQGNERKYRQLLTEKEKRAAEIRAQLFRLAGGVSPISFGEALKYAELVSKFTGVRPAFLLAVLKQESDIGRNVGQCYLKDPQSGSGINIKTGARVERVMNPSRDVPVFLRITQKLGFDPYSTPVSCPLSFGWGGAMGPAQFIPSTWSAYEDSVRKIVGEEPNPWNIYHAFVAAGVKLAEAGARTKTYDSEWKAAMIYFAGSNWSDPAYRFYGDSVMAIAERFEEDIKIIKEAGE